MRAIFKNIYIWIISLFQSVVSLLSIIVFNRIGINRRIEKLACKKERPASILANGPSVKEIINERFDLLINTDLLALNNFANSDYFIQLKPKFYILFDYAYFDYEYKNEKEENQNMSRNEERQVMNNLEKIDWEMVLFVPYSPKERKMMSRFKNHKFLKVIEYHSTLIHGFTGFRNYMFRNNQGVPSTNNVIIPAMLLLSNIGYKTIYLYGAELSWTKTMDVDINNGKMFFKDSHFYDSGKMRYFDKGGYRWWLEAIAKALKGTEDVAEYAKFKGVHIVNRTKGSFVDAFEYENPDSIEKNN